MDTTGHEENPGTLATASDPPEPLDLLEYLDQKDRRENQFTSQTAAHRVIQVYQEQTAHLVSPDLEAALELLDQSDLTDILAPLVLPVHQAQWEATVKATQERKETRVMWDFLVRAVPLATSL